MQDPTRAHRPHTPRRRRTASRVSPSTRTTLCLDCPPRTKATARRGRPSWSARKSVSAAFARPSSAGAWILILSTSPRQPMIASRGAFGMTLSASVHCGPGANGRGTGMREACTRSPAPVKSGTTTQVRNVLRDKRPNRGLAARGALCVSGFQKPAVAPQGAHSKTRFGGTASRPHHRNASASAAMISSTGSLPIESRSRSGSIPLAASSARPAAVFTRS